MLKLRERPLAHSCSRLKLLISKDATGPSLNATQPLTRNCRMARDNDTLHTQQLTWCIPSSHRHKTCLDKQRHIDLEISLASICRGKLSSPTPPLAFATRREIIAIPEGCSQAREKSQFSNETNTSPDSVGKWDPCSHSARLDVVYYVVRSPAG